MPRFLKGLASDDVLAGRIVNDDQLAFEQLYNRYFRKVFYFSVRYIQNRVEAEDLVQTLFVNLWESRKSLNPDLLVKSYIYRSVTNLIYNCLKKRAIRSRHIEYELRKGEQFSNQTYDQLYFQDLEKSIDNVVNSLPPQQKRIFYMSRGQGYSYEKIARTLDISVRTVENQIYRTLRTIKKSVLLKG